ncbi:MAG: NAD-dependent epimerase/dehydratase family protein, partial [Candidatus Poseidoniales archaeon]
AHDHQRFSYGASKYLDEVALQHAVLHGLDGRIVRPFNGYGHRMVGDAYGQVVGMMFQAVKERGVIAVHGDGQQTRSFTHLDDLVDGIYLAGALDAGLNGESLRGASFNIGSTEEVSMLDLAHAINATVGSQAVDIVLAGGYHGDSKRRLPDCTSAAERLGWRAKVSLEEGLRRMWAALQP